MRTEQKTGPQKTVAPRTLHLRPTDYHIRTIDFSALRAQRGDKTAGSKRPIAAIHARQESWTAQATPRSPLPGRKSKRDVEAASWKARATALYVSSAARTNAPGRKLPLRKAVHIKD